MKRNGIFVAVAALSFVALSCGREICVGPVGNCTVASKPSLQSGTTTTATMTITAPDEVSAGVAFNVSVTGGTGPWKFEIASASGGQITQQSASEGKAALSAPLVGNTDMSIRVTDSAKPSPKIQYKSVHVR